ncbi:uncharacterized protein LOC133545923 isoform X2 [Nerophis ophidion]|uniref:uncharacterized protein LOC133545923 isoform X2 n=1 Tax=Nerophis ophidion TaxID=159077 RepID=UPI002ADF7BD2|nr:uncharacterized protein LOC133545923 isoform X2 [Nerophis ophidion]
MLKRRRKIHSPPHIKQEEEELWMRERVCLLGQLTVKTDDHEDQPPESSQLHHSPRSTQQPNNIKVEEEEPQTPSFKEEPTLHVKEDEEEPPTYFKDEGEVPPSPNLQEKEAGECLLGQEEADLIKIPLTVVSVKTEDQENQPSQSSQLHHSPSKPNIQICNTMQCMKQMFIQAPTFSFNLL